MSDEKNRKHAAELDARFKHSTRQEIFSAIYREGLWGKHSGDNTLAPHYSGHGSHAASVVTPYVNAVREFLSTQRRPLTLVDLGCGDFHVGSQFSDLVDSYIAYDIVDDVIQMNRKRYANLSVDFRVADLTTDQIEIKGPRIAVLRQVLQHLSNKDIHGVLKNLCGCRALILTEVIPLGDFKPNLDMKTGRYSRTGRGKHSGVVLSAPPFNLKFKRVVELVKVPFSAGQCHTQTLVYFFDE